MANNRQEIERLAAEAKDRIGSLDDRYDEQSVRNTAERLRLMHYDPGLNIRGEDFLTLRKQDALQEIDRIAALPIEEKEREVRLSYFVKHYELLSRLRHEDDRAWDEVEELYGED